MKEIERSQSIDNFREEGPRRVISLSLSPLLLCTKRETTSGAPSNPLKTNKKKEPAAAFGEYAVASRHTQESKTKWPTNYYALVNWRSKERPRRRKSPQTMTTIKTCHPCVVNFSFSLGCLRGRLQLMAVVHHWRENIRQENEKKKMSFLKKRQFSKVWGQLT